MNLFDKTKLKVITLSIVGIFTTIFIILKGGIINSEFETYRTLDNYQIEFVGQMKVTFFSGTAKGFVEVVASNDEFHSVKLNGRKNGKYEFDITDESKNEYSFEYYYDKEKETVILKKKMDENDIETKEITLSVKNGTITSSGAVFIMKNNSNYEYTYEEPYGIKKLENGKWEELDTLSGEPLPWNDILYNLKPNEEREININWSYDYGKLKSGTYRLVKYNLRKSASQYSRAYSIYAEFDIK